MAQTVSNVVNNFTKGLLTEFTGLNFPEQAATATDNCIYTLIGEVTRRGGFDYEDNFKLNTLASPASTNTYKWNNVGGDGETQVIVTQTGFLLNFFVSSNATITSPLSTTLIPLSVVDIRQFQVTGSTADASQSECQFADGNGYLFVYHPDCDPFFCQYTAGSITPSAIQVQIRDFTGVDEPGVAVNTRPSSLTQEHFYNLTNQGWTSGNPYQASSQTTVTIAVGTYTFSVQTGLAATIGDLVNIVNAHDAFPGGTLVPAGTVIMSGSITSYIGNSMTINVFSTTSLFGVGNVYNDWLITPFDHGYINTWVSDEGNYPSNADVWWYFKDDTGAYNPATTQPNVSLNTSQAPQGHYILNAFSQTRSLVSAISGLTDVVTSARPTNGTWFQGRVWYTGVNAQQAPSGDATFYTWTESIYFSQVITTPTDFGSCYQTNDPTSDNLNSLLPTDGGVIQIQGAGSIYRLFPIANGMIVFAANGVWFITGSQGIGFSADDYTITKLSTVQSISSTSFVNVMGLPYFWNEEGIYSVEPSQQGGMQVNPLTVGTILTFYNSIPLQSKKYARGDYHPINYILQWTYKSVNETGIGDRYQFDSVLNFNTYNKAFYPYSLPTSPQVMGINYVAGPGGSNSPDPVFKYLTYDGTKYTFSEENDFDTYTDFVSSAMPSNFVSFFTTGYRLPGKSLLKFQPSYIYIYSNNSVPNSYYLQGVWDYANTGNSGRWSTQQKVTNANSNYDVVMRKHKIRGRGFVLQLQVTSVDGQPFDIIGWSSWELVNAGI